MGQQIIGRALAVLAAGCVLGLPAPAHADLTGGAGGLTAGVSKAGQAAGQTAQQTTQQVQKVTQTATQKVTQPVAGTVTKTVTKTLTKTVSTTASKASTTAVHTVRKAASAVAQPVAPARRVSPSAPRAGSAPSSKQGSSSARTAPAVRSAHRARGTHADVRRHGRPSVAKVRDRGAAAPASLAVRAVVASPSAKVLAASLVHAYAQPSTAVASSPGTDRRAPQLPDGCQTSSLDPDELRRCALDAVLGPTGGLRAEIPLAGLLTLAVGAMLAMRRPRVASTLA